MNTRIEQVNITPDKSIYHKLGESNYSIPDAIAELVDNSIDAVNEDGVEIYIILDKKSKKIIISDNGVGMNKADATKSIVLAHSNKYNSLGEFGLGMKSACMSLGRTFTLETTKKDSGEKYSFKYDRDEFITKGDWNDFPINIDQEQIRTHGTTITISNLKVKLYDTLVTRLKTEMSNRYSPYIQHNNVIVKIGLSMKSAKPCMVSLPELVKDSKVEREFITSGGEKIKYWFGLLKVGSQKVSGFNMFRRGRLIRASEKLGYNYHPSLMHIYGEIQLNNVPVTHNKREFMFESGEFKDFIENIWGDQTEKYFNYRIKGVIDEITKKSRDRANEEKSDKFPSEKKETITNNILKALNRLDAFKELAFPNLQPGKRSEKGKDSQKESRETGLKVANEEPIVEKKNGKRTPKNTQSKTARFIMVNGEKYRFEFFLQNLDNDRIDKETIISEDKVLQIYINTGFKGYTLTRDTSYYIVLHSSEAIAEIYIREAKQNPGRIIELRNSLLHEVASVILEEEELQRLSKEELSLIKIQEKRMAIEEKQKRASLT